MISTPDAAFANSGCQLAFKEVIYVPPALRALQILSFAINPGHAAAVVSDTSLTVCFTNLYTFRQSVAARNPSCCKACWDAWCVRKMQCGVCIVLRNVIALNS